MEDVSLALSPKCTFYPMIYSTLLTDMRGRSHHRRYGKVYKYIAYTSLFNSYHWQCHFPLNYNMKHNMLTL
jgi:hypothetical protein